MRLTPDELSKIGNSFTALQAIVVAGCDTRGVRKVVVVKPDNSEVVYENDDDKIVLESGDEVEVLPRATGGVYVPNEIVS